MTAAVLLLGGCGEAPVQTQPADPSRSESPAAGSTASPAPEATRISLHVSGGVAGVDERHAVSGGNPVRAFALAADPNLIGYAGDHRTKGVADALTMVLEISYADGSEVRIVTDDGSQAPAEVRELVGLLRDGTR